MRRIGVGDFKVTARMRENVLKVLDTERISYGPFCKEFEQQFSAIHDCRYGVLSNSGTSSLHVAVQTLKELHGWPDGAGVVVPAVTFVATVNVLLHNKLTPVLCDVEDNYYGLNTNHLPRSSWARKEDVYIKGIMPVHLFGMPCDMVAITEWAFTSQWSVIEDSCECMFANHWNRPAGAWSDIACFSTYVAHILTTGVGGIATTNNPDYAAKMRSLVNHGRDGIYISIDDDDADGERLQEIVSRRFNFEAIGHSFRITELEAALALAQLEEHHQIRQARQGNAAYLSSGLAHLEDRLQLPAVRPNTTWVPMMFPIVLRWGDKWDLINHLEERGIETREMLRLTDQPCYKGLWDPADYPVASWLNSQGFYCGCHPGLKKNDLDYILEAFDDYFKT